MSFVFVTGASGLRRSGQGDADYQIVAVGQLGIIGRDARNRCIDLERILCRRIRVKRLNARDNIIHVQRGAPIARHGVIAIDRNRRPALRADGPNHLCCPPAIGVDRVRSLFIPGGRVIPPRTEESGDYPVMDVEAFIAWGNQLADAAGLRTSGFYERQIAQRTERFGNVVHVFSTYATRFTKDDPEPFERGINSIQLLWDQERWWTVTIFWDVEREGNPIPEKYLA